MGCCQVYIGKWKRTVKKCTVVNESVSEWGSVVDVSIEWGQEKYTMTGRRIQCQEEVDSEHRKKYTVRTWSIHRGYEEKYSEDRRSIQRE